MKNKINGACKPALLGVFLSGIVTPVLAADGLSLSAGAGLAAHDNAGLSSTDEKSDTERSVNADVGYLKTDGALNVEMGYSVDYSDYANDLQESETAINGQTALKWLVAPRYLDAVLYHQISQQLTDRRGTEVASNQEERSVVTAGVDGFLHFSGTDSLIFSPRFSDVRFEESDESDSQRASMAVVWNHKISQVSSIDVSANYDDVKFDDGENDYNSPGVLVSFRTALSRLSYQLGLGANRIDRDTGKEVNGSTVRAAIDYKGDTGRDWGASYVHQLTDSSFGLSGVELSLDSFQSDDSNFEEVDIIEVDKADAYWRERISPTSQFSVGAGYQKQDYQETPQDESVIYAQAGYQYTINSRWSTGIDTRFEHTKFSDEPKQEYDMTRIYFNVTYRPSRPLEVRFSVGQDKRDDDNSVNSYTDNVALIGLRYQFL